LGPGFEPLFMGVMGYPARFYGGSELFSVFLRRMQMEVILRAVFPTFTERALAARTASYESATLGDFRTS
jgi:hypothetical protein